MKYLCNFSDFYKKKLLKSFSRTWVSYFGRTGTARPCFWFRVTSPLGFKARVGSTLFACFAEVNVMYVPWDPFWCYTCQTLDGQHGSRLLLHIHAPAEVGIGLNVSACIKLSCITQNVTKADLEISERWEPQTYQPLCLVHIFYRRGRLSPLGSPPPWIRYWYIIC